MDKPRNPKTCRENSTLTSDSPGTFTEDQTLSFSRLAARRHHAICGSIQLSFFREHSPPLRCKLTYLGMRQPSRVSRDPFDVSWAQKRRSSKPKSPGETILLSAMGSSPQKRQSRSKTGQQVRRRFKQVVNLHDLNFAPYPAFLCSNLLVVGQMLVLVKLQQLRHSNLSLTFVILRWIIHSNILVVGPY